MKCHEDGRMEENTMAKVGILMGSDSDLPVMKKAAEMLEKFGIEYEMTIISAHRMPDVFVEYASKAEERGIEVIIAGAGGAAHLPGMCAALFDLPVIGIPIHTKSLGGVDSLYSIVQMPSGIPVATVAIDGAANAGILAAKILSVSDRDLRMKLKNYKSEMKDGVTAKADKLNKLGYEEYIRQM
jgi:5-(carboxyamino)imidazole ribonucleotide mutase